ncbi:hypothetical protein PSQ40_15835 [Curvibacter sp. HBC61]|uniref:Pilus formation protein N-terminal domain-containing protein n=1 Tax=Curvibacter cyanobacteriorum TaxID=3026422 RepID=A0ABT5N1A9_9BURK|nr:hypothetical protein [Curvibacter sp. HBC61]MDD0840055.1 hypothetical protein [Curvibacter sp. HBC61]
MNRCFSLPRRLAWRSVCAALALSALPVLAQVRDFPASALRGTLVVTQPPIVQMDGVQTRLSPGARIRNTENLMVLSGSLVNQTLTVNYTRDSHGLVHEIWILTAAEAALKRPSAAPSSNLVIDLK